MCTGCCIRAQSASGLPGPAHAMPTRLSCALSAATACRATLQGLVEELVLALEDLLLRSLLVI